MCEFLFAGDDNEETHPNVLKCFVNRDGIDFTEVAELRPTQVFELPVNPDGSVELITAIHPFTNVNSLAFYFPSNYGAETTSIKYIGMQGEHTHFRREAVHTTYEVLCTGCEEVDHANPVASEPSH